MESGCRPAGGVQPQHEQRRSDCPAYRKNLTYRLRPAALDARHSSSARDPTQTTRPGSRPPHPQTGGALVALCQLAGRNGLPKGWPLSGGEPRLQSWGKGAKALAALAEISNMERTQPERPTPTLNTWSTPTGVVGPVTSAALCLQPHWLLMVTMLKATSIVPHGFSFCLVLSALRP